jgi:hypothetical protein
MTFGQPLAYAIGGAKLKLQYFAIVSMITLLSPEYGYASSTPRLPPTRPRSESLAKPVVVGQAEKNEQFRNEKSAAELLLRNNRRALNVRSLGDVKGNEEADKLDALDDRLTRRNSLINKMGQEAGNAEANRIEAQERGEQPARPPQSEHAPVKTVRDSTGKVTAMGSPITKRKSISIPNRNRSASAPPPPKN